MRVLLAPFNSLINERYIQNSNTDKIIHQPFIIKPTQLHLPLSTFLKLEIAQSVFDKRWAVLTLWDCFTVYNKIAMQRQRREVPHREHPLRNPEMSVKIPAKKIVNLPRHALIGQQSAHRPTRPHKEIREEGVEEAVRNSAMYRMLEEEMKAMRSRHEAEQGRLRDLKTAREQQLARAKREQFATKLQIWELKNEVMELK